MLCDVHLLSLNTETNNMNLLKITQKQLTQLTLILLATITSFSSQATIVQFETSFGNFSVNLYDEDTPVTVANFLQYVDDGNGNNAYSNVIIHRSIDNFVLQGGGFSYNGGAPLNTQNLPIDTISSNPAIINEPVFSNVRGTIAMAKVGGNVNSATNQWFFNLVDNSTNLDNQNGGFSVFGEVTAEGQTILEQMAAVQKYDFGGAFTSIPLDNYDGTSVPNNSNLLIITSIQIIDPSANTAASLSPLPNLNNSPIISGTPATGIEVGTAYNFTPTASSQNGDAFTFTVTNLPTWANFDTVTGEISGTPTSSDVGSYSNIVITVTSDENELLLNSLPAFNITVTEEPPATSGGGGGGAVSWLILILLSIRFKKR